MSSSIIPNHRKKSDLDSFPYDDLYFGGIVFSEMRRLVSTTPLAWTKGFADLGVSLTGESCRFLDEARLVPSLKLETGEHVLVGVVGTEKWSDAEFSMLVGIFDEDGRHGEIFHIWKGDRWSYASGVKASRKTENELHVREPISAPELKRKLSDDRIVSFFSQAAPLLREQALSIHAEAERGLLSKMTDADVLSRCGIRP